MRPSFLATLLMALAAGASAQTPPATERQVGDDHFAAGGRVRVVEPVAGDLFAAGGRIEVDAPVGGDVLLAGGQLRLRGAVGRSAYLAGGQVTLDGPVGHNVRIGAGRIEFTRNAQVDGNVSVGGGSVRLEGTVKGYLQAGGGHVLIDGRVDGDVTSTGGSVELGPNARLGGRLRYASRDDVQIDPAAQVASGVERLALPAGRAASGVVAPQRPDEPRGLNLVWTAGLMLLAAALVASAPGFSASTTKDLAGRTGLSLLSGFVVLVCVPVAALVLAITLIGIPIALLVIAAYFALLLGGYVVGALGVGLALLERFGGERAARQGWQVAAAAGAVLLIAWLGLAPWLGPALAALVLCGGVGAIVLQLPAARRIAPR